MVCGKPSVCPPPPPLVSKANGAISGPIFTAPGVCGAEVLGVGSTRQQRPKLCVCACVCVCGEQ